MNPIELYLKDGHSHDCKETPSRIEDMDKECDRIFERLGEFSRRLRLAFKALEAVEASRSFTGSICPVCFLEEHLEDCKVGIAIKELGL
jgi:hypothetical protein